MVQSSSILVAISALSLVDAWTSPSPLSTLSNSRSSIRSIPPSTYQRRTTFCSVQRSPFQETSASSSSKSTSQQEGTTSSSSSSNFFPWISSSEDKQLMEDSFDLKEEDTSSLYVANERAGVNPLVVGGGAIAAIGAASLVFSGQLDAM